MSDTPKVDVYVSPITLKDIYIFYVSPICVCERVNPSELHIWAYIFTPNVDVYASPITLKDIYIFYVSPICVCERVNPSELHIWA
ncbi:hypothetical protein Syun_002395 [Stephania yunnanensis]|uniref:Uncharacterized protein n=1 Tax=Stephania yunnanensis TaxID=152371 RepID=A0AAP0LGD7_9MAGN